MDENRRAVTGLTINTSDIAGALDEGSSDIEMVHVLDTLTGNATFTTQEDIETATELIEDVPGDQLPSPEEFDRLFDQAELPDWQRELLWEALLIDADAADRFRRIGPDGSREAFKGPERP